MVVLTDGLVVLRPWRVAEAIRAVAGDPDRPGWAIVAAGSGELLGNAALDLAAGSVSYWVAPAGRGRGVATAALRLNGRARLRRRRAG